MFPWVTASQATLKNLGINNACWVFDHLCLHSQRLNPWACGTVLPDSE